MAKAGVSEIGGVRYEEDLYAWSLEQAALLRARRAERLDWDHLAAEIEWLVGRDRRELKNRLRIILLHLWKWQRQPGSRGARWRKSLHTQPRHIEDLLQESPSLRRLIPELVREAFPDAVKDAADETCLPREQFPADCPYAPMRCSPRTTCRMPTSELPDRDGAIERLSVALPLRP